MSMEVTVMDRLTRMIALVALVEACGGTTTPGEGGGELGGDPNEDSGTLPGVGGAAGGSKVSAGGKGTPIGGAAGAVVDASAEATAVGGSDAMGPPPVPPDGCDTAPARAS
jgi:hypothetical protein